MENTEEQVSKVIVITTIIDVIVIIIFCCFCFYAYSHNYCYKTNYIKHGEITQVSPHVYVEDGCSKSEEEKIQKLVRYLPKSLLNKFKADNGRIVLVNDLQGDIVGSTEYRKNEVIVYIKNGYVFDALLHEFGHVYLRSYGMPKGFNSIWKTEASALVNAYYGGDADESYFIDDEEEYFAQAFQTVIMMSGYDTQNVAPKTFSCITELMKQMVAEK